MFFAKLKEVNMHTVFIFVISITNIYCNIVTPGKIQPFLNQTSLGIYRFKGWQRDGLQFHSYWYQDDNEQKLALGIGERDKDLQAHFWFFRSNAYELKPVDHQDQSKGYKCYEFMDFNYTMEVSAYDHRYLQSIGQMTMKEDNETIPAEFFMGVALDGVGPLNVLAVTDTRDGTYVKLYTTQSIGVAAYSEYYLYPRNDSIPDPKHFKLPAECTNPNNPPQKVYFFKKFNMKGQRIDKKPCSNNGSKHQYNIAFAFLTNVILFFKFCIYY